MSTVFIATIITVVALGIIAAVILYWASQKFKVIEDPRIDEVEEALPAANCGGCGFPGCRNFAEACVKADDLNDLNCPVGGNETMSAVASILGKEVEEKEKMIAVLLCHGSPEFRKNTSQYDGAANCTIVSDLYGGETNCQYGCLGLGECTEVCDFEAIHMNPVTNLPEVVEANCTACNACVEICPKNILELRPVGKKSRRIYVSCKNEDMGGQAKKACSVACIGCGLCFKVCPFDAITMKNNLAYIHADACKLCRKCVDVCPTDAIHELNFPPKRKPKPKAKKKEATKKTSESEGSIDIVKEAKKNSDQSEKK
ncbi:MAG: RnfABCDGE type electron transport complex subunit B [Bacteroidota bacterium]|nr:RnfABCDGE type electron transport complex subunit B [Bacteroidota bacterium]